MKLAFYRAENGLFWACDGSKKCPDPENFGLIKLFLHIYQTCYLVKTNISYQKVFENRKEKMP